MDSPFAKAAPWYARRGLRVLPLHPLTKEPIHQAWQVKATTDLLTIRRWALEQPGANLGIATGADSGIFALDVDAKHGGDQTLAELEHQHGELPPTWRARTAN